jgi:photosystem II stability/assembly factor-like uncharacterized protein
MPSLSDNIGHLLETKDGGINWNMVQIPFSDITTFYFLNKNSGWASGLYSNPDSNTFIYGLFHTSNGCKTWDIVETGYIASDIYFKDTLVGWIVGKGGLFLNTIDGGKTWVRPTIQKSDENNTMFGGIRNSNYSKITFLDSDRGCIVGDNQAIYLTEDGGKNWLPQNIPDGGDFNSADVALVSKNNIWVVAYLDGLIHYDGNGWRYLKIDDCKKMGLVNNCNPDSRIRPYKICFSDSDNGWVGCMDGCIFFTHNGGKKWKQIPAKITDSQIDFCQDPDSKSISYTLIFQSPDGYTYIYGRNLWDFGGKLQSVLLKIK